jgi:subtilisin family serine protease
VAPDCELYVGKVLDDAAGSGFDSDIIDGIQWAITSGCRIISMSLGSVRAPGAPAALQYELIARRLLDRADGTLIIAAAGNESERSAGIVAPVGNPAACPSIVAIAAIDADRQIADFSCGQVDQIGVVDLAAPGVSVYSSVPVAQGTFEEFNGTSMATPHAAGVAACHLQADPTLTPRQLWDRLKATAWPLSLPAQDVGRGLVHV